MRKRYVAAALVLMLGGAFLSPSGTVSAKEEQRSWAEDCSAYDVYALRGSGEGQAEPTPLTNGWEGDILSRAFDTFSEHPDLAEVSEITTISPDMGYVAVDPVSAAVRAAFEGGTIADGALWNIYDSATEGTMATAAEMLSNMREHAAVGCAPRQVLFGYSQGAVAARLTADLLPGFVEKVLVVGDMTQTADSAVRGTGGNNRGIFYLPERTNSAAAGSRELVSTRIYDDKDTFAYCTAGDNFCAATPFWVMNLNNSEHRSYFTDAATGRDELSEWLSGWDTTVPSYSFPRRYSSPTSCSTGHSAELLRMETRTGGRGAEPGLWNLSAFVTGSLESKDWLFCGWAATPDFGRTSTLIASVSPDFQRAEATALKAQGAQELGHGRYMLRSVDNGGSPYTRDVAFRGNLMVVTGSWGSPSSAYADDVLRTLTE